jgi:integrase
MAGKRRGQGEGSIFQAQDGRWRAVVDLGWQNGKRHRQYLSGNTRKEVQDKLKIALREQQQGVTPAPQRQTVGQFLETWLRDVRGPKLEPSTYSRYEVTIRRHLIPALGKRPLAKLTTAEIQGFYAHTRLAPTTVRLSHAIFRSALETAVQWDLLAKNPASHVELPKVPQRDLRVLDSDAARQFLQAAQGDPREALYITALTTGMRIGELLGLRWADLDVDAGVVHVQRKLLHLGKRIIEGSPKSAAGRRRVELDRLAVDALRRHRARQLELRLQLGADWARPDLVFTTETGRPQRADTVTCHYLPRLLQKAGLAKMVFHDLRRSMITLMLSNGESISVVSQMVGHSNAAMTLSRYRAILPNEQRGAVNRLGALLTDPPSSLAADLAANGQESP